MKASCVLAAMVIFCSFIAGQNAERPKDELYQYEGTYEFPDGRRITLGIFDEFKKSLVYLDLRTLRQGALIPVSGDTFKENNDSNYAFEFDRDDAGRIGTLKITKNGTASTARRVMPHTRTPVTFRSAGRRLSGDLYMPKLGGRHPVVVFAHGSGAATRSVSFFTTFFLQIGVGVLSFDKQGAGESEGDWETASFDALASDIVAAIDFAAGWPGVDSKRVGILGNSQGGWVGSMAAAKSREVDFLLMRVGSGQSVADTVAHEYKGMFLADGMSEKDADEAVGMFREHWARAAKGGSWEEGNAIIESYRGRPWFTKIYPTPREKTPSSEKWWLWLKLNLHYDSYDFLKKVKVPVLWLLAEKDWNVNSQASYSRVIDALKLAGNRDYTVKILPNMGHSGLIVKTGFYTDAFSWQYAPGFWETMAKWLQDRGFAPSPKIIK
jgi:dienelactone hydrolase